MIQCDADEGCYGWYHFICEGLTVDKVDRIDQYACKGCTKAGLGETTYERHNVGAETHVDDVENDSDDTEALVPNSRKRKVASQRVL
jgi:hypothetical protein